MNKTSWKHIAILVFTFVLLSCSTPAHTPASSVPVTPQLEAGNVEIGHMVYIPLNLEGGLEQNIESVMVVVNDWEKANPDLQIVDLDPIDDQHAYSTSAYTYGVWIYFTEKDKENK